MEEVKKEEEDLEFRNQVEAILFSAAKRVSYDELKSLLNLDLRQIKKAILNLQKKYDNDTGSVMLINDGDTWKLTVKDKYVKLVHKIVTETELSKTIMETLAIIAFKHPIMQSELVKIRSNKVYDHIKELKEIGYVTVEPMGRTRKIKLTNKFFEYFDLPPNKVREAFASFEAVEKVIEEKENEARAMKSTVEKRMEEIKNGRNKHESEIEIVDIPDVQEKIILDKEENSNIENNNEPKIGELKVVQIDEGESSDSEEENDDEETLEIENTESKKEDESDKRAEEILNSSENDEEIETVNLAGVSEDDEDDQEEILKTKKE